MDASKDGDNEIMTRLSYNVQSCHGYASFSKENTEAFRSRGDLIWDNWDKWDKWDDILYFHMSQKSQISQMSH